MESRRQVSMHLKLYVSTKPPPDPGAACFVGCITRQT